MARNFPTSALFQKITAGSLAVILAGASGCAVAPSKTVTDFLTAVKAGDKAKADALLGDPSFKTLEKDGKWIGYFIVSNAGTLDFFADQIVGKEIKPSEPEFSTIGPGSAMVSSPSERKMLG